MEQKIEALKFIRCKYFFALITGKSQQKGIRSGIAFRKHWKMFCNCEIKMEINSLVCLVH